MANEQNLKSWKPGQSGNPAGKPRGTRHLSTWIQELMEDEQLTRRFAHGDLDAKAPVQAIVTALIGNALQGDLKSFELLARYGYGTKLDVTSKDKELPLPILGFFNGPEPPKPE